MKWQVKGEKRGLVVGLTAPTGPVRGLVRSRPWVGPCPSVNAWAQKFGVHGHIADGGGPENAPRTLSVLVSGLGPGQEDRAAKPSALAFGNESCHDLRKRQYGVLRGSTVSRLTSSACSVAQRESSIGTGLPGISCGHQSRREREDAPVLPNSIASSLLGTLYDNAALG
jgi:hypothetical protein